MINEMIISIDWDHTLRRTNGLDLNLVILMMYAQANSIPFGITSHRDIENTVLYTLYYWQHRAPERNCDALAAAINYWLNGFFMPMHIKFDFINTRYQPMFKDKNYYQDVLLAVELELESKINKNKILQNQPLVRSTIAELTSNKEQLMPDNEYKESQIAWLCEKYIHQSDKNKLIVHIDDDQKLCHHLPINSKHEVTTIYCEEGSLLLNEMYLDLCRDTGLFEYSHDLLESDFTPSKYNTAAKQLSFFSACMLLAQFHHNDINTLSQIEEFRLKLEPSLDSHLAYCNLFCKKFIATVSATQYPICLLSNDLVTFI